MKSKSIRPEAKNVASSYCLAIRACTQGSQLKWMHDGKNISARLASTFYEGVNRSTLGRYPTKPKYAALKKAVLGADFDSDHTPERIEMLAKTIFRMVQPVGHPTFLDWQEEYDLVMHLVELGKRGFSQKIVQIKATALWFAVRNHAGSETTSAWAKAGVSHDWYVGFMSRWEHVLSQRSSEGFFAKRRQILNSQCLSLFDQLEELGRLHGVDVVDGVKRLSPGQLCNLSETCINFKSKDEPVVVMKGQSKALRAEGVSFRRTMTLVPVVFADGTYLRALIHLF